MRTAGKHGAGSRWIAGSFFAFVGCAPLPIAQLDMRVKNKAPASPGLCGLGADIRQDRNRGDPDSLSDIDIEACV